MQDNSDTETPWLNPIAVRELRKNASRKVRLELSQSQNAALARYLGILTVKKSRLTGEISPLGSRDWQFTGQLGATIEQECVVTLNPVTTRIDEPVSRTFLADMDIPQEEGVEIEMADDENIEPLRDTIDPGLILAEALALALPAYPRSTDDSPSEMTFTEPGKTAMSDEEARPFAGLAGLRDKLQKDAE